jgi:hypothetical protein
MNEFASSESLHRLIKHALDSGVASSLAEAEAMFRGYCVHFSIDPADADDQHHQAALLTGVALAQRVFLGGVSVAGTLSAPLRVPMPLGRTLADAISGLGAQLVANRPIETPIIHIGGGPRPRTPGFAVRAVFADWRGGVVPSHARNFQLGSTVMALSPMLAAALAVSEAFFHVQGNTPIAGRRSVGFSLWNPDEIDWFAADPDAPPLRFLPSHLWLIGLGHLGQAFLWALSLLPYENPKQVTLVLQDTDKITPSTESTSILSSAAMVGTKKTRAMAEWAERRGFVTDITERLFDNSFKRAETDPAIALCGLDNAVGRLALDSAGFPLVVEAGLGRDYRNFQTIRLHTLPGRRSAAEIWGGSEPYSEDLAIKPAYKKLLGDGMLDQCGITVLAGKAVGAPFVGSAAAALAIAEIVRFLHGGPLHQLIDLDLRSPDSRSAVRQSTTIEVNPGYVLARSIEPGVP